MNKISVTGDLRPKDGFAVSDSLWILAELDSGWMLRRKKWVRGVGTGTVNFRNTASLVEREFDF